MNALEVKNLSYHYPDGRRALSNISSSFKENERVAIIGPNGAGKSTLLLHMNGLLPDHLSPEPTVYVFGEALTRSNILDIRTKVGLLFQEPDDQLFCSTVEEDVAFGPQQLGLSPDDISARVKKSLQAVGLDGFEKRAPTQLSHGEKRRVCIAGLLSCDSSILVLDEPTSGLDPRGRHEISVVLEKLELTQIIATHDLRFVDKHCSRVILIDEGKVVCEGTTRDLLLNEELMIQHGLEKLY